MYSRININKGHVFDHNTGKVLCGTKHGWAKPNKRTMDAPEMLKKHSAIAINRGLHNPYKFCCIKCEEKLAEIVKGEVGHGKY